jgi:alpha-1,4-digalacturonate transport system permease protein
MTTHSKKNVWRSVGSFFNNGLSSLSNFVIDSMDVVFGALQRVVGLRGMPYIFVLPNLLIFGIFIVFPMLLNF